jgi:hypothetical protein
MLTAGNSLRSATRQVLYRIKTSSDTLRSPSADEGTNQDAVQLTGILRAPPSCRSSDVYVPLGSRAHDNSVTKGLTATHQTRDVFISLWQGNRRGGVSWRA